VAAVKRDPRCPLKGHSRRMRADVGDEHTESRSVIQLLRIPSMILPERPSAVVFVVR